jgi:hypothetical protein
MRDSGEYHHRLRVRINAEFGDTQRAVIKVITGVEF